ncbi:hypothetical protein [Lawsonibacter sp. JLR.KK007]|uniref:hypothetical protein n=1 Tax=Lawsonibacter sp. JLR.KK007 TaxID=3114293 RepID=UPI002FEEA980
MRCLRRRIRGVALGALPEWPELAPCFSGRRDREGKVDLPSLQVDFARLRGVFIAKNLESMQYDLAVLDEFQNYTQILSLSGQADTEADQIVQRLLGAVLEQIWDMDEGEDGDSCPALTCPEQFGEEFDRLMRFMGEGQETGLQTPADAGIFRTTRGLRRPIRLSLRGALA